MLTRMECFDTVNQVIPYAEPDESARPATNHPRTSRRLPCSGFILNRDYDSASAQELDRDDTDGTGRSTWYHYELTYRA